MLKLVVVLAVTVGAFAGSGCFFQEEYACTSKNSVRCGDDWCSGDCAVELKKACDEKVLFKTTCELKDFCKAVEIPCGHNGDDPDGLNCAFDQECITTKKCKLIRASKVRSNYYGSLKKMGNGFVEICEDKFTCGAVDPWALDAEAITVVCTKEYKVVDDMDCATLFTDKSIWGAGLITEEKFFKMNSGFSCDKKLVGKLVCVEADATIKGETCSDGTTCDPGFECASKEECSNVAVTSPVCAKKPVFTCLSTPGSATLCGNKVCSGNQKCEIISKKVCPVVLPATGAVGGTVFVPGSGPVVVPGTNPVVIPGTNPSTAPVVVPGTIPGSAPIVIPGTNPVVIPGTTPGAGTPGVVTPQAAPLVVNGQVVPAISSVSSSLADDLGTVVGVDVVDNAGLYGYAGGSASTQDSFSVGYSLADNRNVFVASDSATTAASGESAVTQADGVSNVVARDQAFIVAEGTSDSQGVAGLTNSNTFAQSDFGIGSATAAALNTVDENFSAANSFADPTTAESITDTATLPGTVGEANAGADVRGNVTPP